MAAEQFKIKKSIIPNHLWSNLEVLLKNIGMASPLFPYEVLEIWDENNDTFDECLSNITKRIQIDISLTTNEQFKVWNIASNDETNRTQAVELIKRRIAKLSSIGIHNFTITSPYKINNTSYSQFCLSILDICEFSWTKEGSISFEAFDTNKDKCRLIGNTVQILELMKFLEKHRCTNFFLTWDLGHFALEEGDYKNSLCLLLKYIKRVHISNYSTDRTKWYFGDKHLPFNGIGNITEEDIISVLSFISQNESSIESVAFEVAPHKDLAICNTSIQTYRYLNSLLDLIG